ncbi:hypothetical protein [Nitrosomonas sp. Nm166]|uniref:hypothetical protein n=1 Tax=Nitrosomonas sp. Nm166 TaxID=1881054 RepID=UPI0008EE46A5|nr:hypothetical protein [Nitrosomonas sp. Nm166]SFE85658.1 hypothetical protein SAMN05428977_103317 [Nitrosomonas sp. Nm166]
MNINLHIERLVLDGINIGPDQKHLLHSIVTTELTRLLTEGDISPNLAKGVAMPRISADSIQVAGNDPVQLGQQIAQSVYEGISHE